MSTPNPTSSRRLLDGLGSSTTLTQPFSIWGPCLEHSPVPPCPEGGSHVLKAGTRRMTGHSGTQEVALPHGLPGESPGECWAQVSPHGPTRPVDTKNGDRIILRERPRGRAGKQAEWGQRGPPHKTGPCGPARPPITHGGLCSVSFVPVASFCFHFL